MLKWPLLGLLALEGSWNAAALRQQTLHSTSLRQARSLTAASSVPDEAVNGSLHSQAAQRNALLVAAAPENSSTPARAAQDRPPPPVPKTMKNSTVKNSNISIGKATKPVKPATSWDLYATPGASASKKKHSVMLIPKILHQTYKGQQLPPRFAKYRETWGQYLSKDWARKLWTQEELRNLIKEHYPWFLETYDTYEQDVNRIYAARIFLMHHYGGVYADLDIEALTDPTPLFNGDYDMVFFYSRPPKFRRPWSIDHPKGNAMGTICNSMMASVSKHPFWLFVAQRMLKAAKEASGLREKLYTTGGWGYKYKDVMWTTGSSLLTDSLAEYQEKFPDAIIGIFSNKFWSPWKNDAKDEVCEGPKACLQLHPDAFTVHHWTGSWNHCTPGTCLQKPKDTTGKRVHKRAMPPPPLVQDGPQTPNLQESPAGTVATEAPAVSPPAEPIPPAATLAAEAPAATRPADPIPPAATLSAEAPAASRPAEPIPSETDAIS
mmetsp:Transcript_18375/g.43077  ORF Transcript_18375/g.43077 Transcript_18375/m.43077 type:complete len:492 (-) Transcript_18375:92-1567(-)